MDLAQDRGQYTKSGESMSSARQGIKKRQIWSEASRKNDTREAFAEREFLCLHIVNERYDSVNDDQLYVSDL